MTNKIYAAIFQYNKPRFKFLSNLFYTTEILCTEVNIGNEEITTIKQIGLINDALTSQGHPKTRVLFYSKLREENESVSESA